MRAAYSSAYNFSENLCQGISVRESLSENPSEQIDPNALYIDMSEFIISDNLIFVEINYLIARLLVI